MPFNPVVIVIVNWNLKDETARCLSAIRQFASASQTIVVDNGSTDGSVESLTAQFPEISLVRLPANLGFGPACNYGIRRALAQADCEFVLLLNNDALLTAETIAALVQAARDCPRGGIFGPKVYYQDRPNVLWYAGAQRQPGLLAAINTKRGQVDCGQASHGEEVDYVFGAAMLIRRAVFEQVGLFDENFFLYMEDLDLCLRAQAAGFRLWFVPQAQVYHLGSASTRRHLEVRKYHYVRSTLKFLRKHLHPGLLIPAVFFWLGVFVGHLGQDLRQGNFQAWPAYSRGLFHGVREMLGPPASPPVSASPPKT